MVKRLAVYPGERLGVRSAAARKLRELWATQARPSRYTELSERITQFRIDRVRRTKRGDALHGRIVSGRYPMAREFSVIIERDVEGYVEGYYVASVPALRGCHTQATSLDELIVRVREAVERCLEVQGENVEPLDFIGVQKITVA